MTRREPPTITELRHRLPAVRQRLDEALGNIPSSEGGGGKGSHGDRTATLAINADHDIAMRDSKLITEQMGTILRLAAQGRSTINARFTLDDLLRRWELSERQAEGLRVHGDDSGTGWCQSHWRAGHTEEPRTPGSKFCRWCEDWTRTYRAAGLDVTAPSITHVDASARGVPHREQVRLMPTEVRRHLEQNKGS